MDSKTQKQKHKFAAANMKKSQSQIESPLSPLRYQSPLRSDLGDPPESPPYSSPLSSPEKLDKSTQFSPAPVAMANRAMREEQPPGVTRVGPAAGEEGRVRGVSSSTPSSSAAVEQAALGLRLCEVVLCLISFSVMAADRTQGWSGDSFDRYKEYRYCLSVNVIAFVYAGIQAFDLAYHLMTRKYFIRHHLRCYFAFFMDQVLAYLLISASSSAASRVDDWQSNWGKDEFTIMASASVAMSFLAFVAFALSSLISGYDLCTQDLA